MLAVFGSMFALMLVFLVVINAVSEAAVQERLREGESDGEYRIERMDGGSGFVVIVFPALLRIVETAESVPAGAICNSSGPFRRYAERVYSRHNEQLVFFILEGGVPTMAEARDCLRLMWPDTEVHIGWVIADNELMKSVMLDDIPEYIREHAEMGP
ncbi:MAG: hypothetical protein J4F97_01370 [Pseudomonadales bacterium]|nr:hypothetical protein [Pseudomonadales bacterium]